QRPPAPPQARPPQPPSRPPHQSPPPVLPPTHYPHAQTAGQQPAHKLRPEQIVVRVAIAFALLLVIAGGAYWYFMSGAQPQPAVGTAEVVGARAAIYEGP